jgi:hypothetical protein
MSYEIAFRLFSFGRRRRRGARRVYSRVGVPQPIHFRDGQELSLLGRNFTIRIAEGTGATSRVRTAEGVVSITLADALNQRQRKKHISALSRRAISASVLPDLRSRVEGLNARHFNFELGGVRIKDQLTRWGSYSKRTNTIYLNFRLLFAPEDVLDYVIVHELAHIRELNHSKEFWSLVGGAVPDFKARKKWLRENGGRLGSEPRMVQTLLAA